MAVMSVWLGAPATANESDTPGLVPVEIIGTAGERRSLAVQIGTEATIRDLAPGQYTVRAFLPSGEVPTTCTFVEEGEAPPRVVLRPATSAHEWLGWETFLGDVAPAERYDDVTDRTTAPLWMRMWQLDHSTPTSTWRAFGWPPSHLESDLRIWKITLPLVVDEPQILQIGGPDLRWRSVVLPPGPPGTSARLTLRLGPSEGRDGLSIQVGTEDRRFDGLLRYLGGSDQASLGPLAEEVGHLAEQLLHEKTANIFGAVVGAHVLLVLGEFPRMHDWTHNLADWFPNVSDGAILHASRLLREHPDGSWTEIRNQLLEASHRPSPVLTESVNLLHRGLQLISRRRKKDSKVEAAMARTEALAAALDPTATFTTFTGIDPNHPDPLAPTGAPTDDIDVQWLPEAETHLSTALPLLATTSRGDDPLPTPTDAIVRAVVRAREAEDGSWLVTSSGDSTVLDSRHEAESLAVALAKELGPSRLFIERDDGSTTRFEEFGPR